MTHSVDQNEIQQFSKDSARWWDEGGPFAPLHKLNPVRMRYIKEQICAHYGRDVNDLNALSGLNILDIGCGGGLVCESLARLGASVTGVDADAQAIDVATAHAKDSGLDISYENKSAEEIDTQFDVVLALEIIEHVNDPANFVKSVSRRAKTNGLAIFSTLNRNPKSFLLGIVAAEYLLRWVPTGTHSYKKFIKPSELSRFARAHDLKTLDVRGLIYNPLDNAFALSKRDLDVNYLLSCKKV